MLDLCAAMAVSALAASAVAFGGKPLLCAVRVEAARVAVITALLEARRTAYQFETNVAVETAPGASQLVLQPSGTVRPLGDGVLIASAPSDGNVLFRATGLADNATIALACASPSAAAESPADSSGGIAQASVVVNQRGVIR